MWEAFLDALFEAIGDMADTTMETAASTDAETLEAQALADDVTGSLDKQALKKSMRKVWAKWVKRINWQRFEELLRRRMNKTRGSSGNPYNVPNAFAWWIKNGDPKDIQAFSVDVVKDFLYTHYHMSPTIVDRAVETLRTTPLSQNKRNKFHEMNKTQAWYYLTNTHHSDNTIYRIRRRNISCDKLRCEMELRFMSGPQHSYNYYKVPMFVFGIMTMIPLTYLTKNGYLAGAWNFFWYSSLTGGLVGSNVHPSPIPSFPFFNKKGFGKDEIEDMRKMRLDKAMAEPTHRKIWHKAEKLKWFTKYMKKPTRKKWDRGTTSHLKKK